MKYQRLKSAYQSMKGPLHSAALVGGIALGISVDLGYVRQTPLPNGVYRIVGHVDTESEHDALLHLFLQRREPLVKTVIKYGAGSFLEELLVWKAGAAASSLQKVFEDRSGARDDFEKLGIGVRSGWFGPYLTIDKRF
jgi:hypothetical protein